MTRCSSCAGTGSAFRADYDVVRKTEIDIHEPCSECDGRGRWEWLRYSPAGYELSSGLWSNWFVDGRALFAHPEFRPEAIEHFKYRIADYKWHFVPVPHGGCAWAEALADVTPRAVLGEPKKPLTVRGRIAVVEDVVTTGETAKAVADRVAPLNYHGMQPPIFAIVDRRMEPYQEPTVSAWMRLPLSVKKRQQELL